MHMYILFHTLTITVVNSWFLYRRDCKELSQKLLPLHIFQTILAESLAKRNKSVCRPSAADIESPPPKKYKITKPTVSDVRYDQVAHWPVHEKKRNRCTCKWCTSGYSSWNCSKCQVMLCMVPDRNCLTAYHQK